MKVEDGKKILIKYYLEQLKKLKDTNFPTKDISFIKIKFSHSFDCYNISKKILESETFKNKSESFKNRVEISCLLHDVGRFFELARELSGKPHGSFGAELLEKNKNITDKAVLLAIANHDKESINLKDDKYYEILNDDDKKDSLEILKLLRDIDKIANLYLFKKNDDIYTRKDKKYGFSEEYFEALQNKHLIDKKYKNTIFDSIAYYIVWYHELEFESSKEFCRKYGLIQHLLNMFQKYINIIEQDELNYYTMEEVKNKKNKMIECLIRIEQILKKQNII